MAEHLSSLLRRALDGWPELWQVAFRVAVLEPYLTDPAYRVVRSDTVGRLSRAGGINLDFGMAPDEQTVHATLGELASRLPPREREHWLAHVEDRAFSGPFVEDAPEPHELHGRRGHPALAGDRRVGATVARRGIALDRGCRPHACGWRPRNEAGAWCVGCAHLIPPTGIGSRKHFRVHIAEGSFSFERDQDSINREAALDGIAVIRTNASLDRLDDMAAVEAYKSLKHVEQAFRTMKTTLLQLRPIFHRLEDRVRAHALLCMLAYYVVWHMRQALRPILEETQGFQGLQHILARLSTMQRLTMQMRGYTFHLVTEPDPFQLSIFTHLQMTPPKVANA